MRTETTVAAVLVTVRILTEFEETFRWLVDRFDAVVAGDGRARAR